MCVLTFGLHHEVLCFVLSVVLSWPFGKQLGCVVYLRPFVLGHEVLSVVLSWSSERQLSFAAVVCVLTFVFHHDVLCAVLSVVLSWSSGRQLWLFVLVVLGRFVVHGLVLLKPGRGWLEIGGWG